MNIIEAWLMAKPGDIISHPGIRDLEIQKFGDHIIGRDKAGTLYNSVDVAIKNANLSSTQWYIKTKEAPVRVKKRIRNKTPDLTEKKAPTTLGIIL